MNGVRLLALFALITIPSCLYASHVHIEPVPDWVDQISSARDFTVPTGRTQQGVYHLLADIQSRETSTEDSTTYYHFASQAISSGGVQSIADITINFHPDYQQLLLHEVNVIRDDISQARLRTTEIQLLQREGELERRLLDGSLTASLFLDDVRAGDIVEYRYSVRGKNPVFEGLSIGNIWLQWTVPLLHHRSRLLISADRELRFAHYNTDIRPKHRKQDGWQEYIWEQFDVEELLADEEAPLWYQPHARAQWSEYDNWGAVAHWALPHYQSPQPTPEAVKAVAADIIASTNDPGERLAQALQFVQREIRYLSMAIGDGSHRPNPPDTVLRRRFGDCKDKTLLLMTLLDELGIEAHAALVNTQLQRGIEDWLPSPHAFDHVLVRARANGQIYWLDPTREPQPSSIDYISQADFDLALIIEPGSTALVSMTPSIPEPHQQTVHTIIDLSSGNGEPADYIVETTFSGFQAENTRAMLASNNAGEIQRQYTNYYAHYFPDIRLKKAFVVEDDLQTNRLQITEHYEILEPWVFNPDKQWLEFSVHAPEMLAALSAPASSQRLAPLARPYPFSLRHITEVLLDGSGWQIDAEDYQIADDAFTFSRFVRPSDATIVITDDYQALTDHVPANDVTRFLANIKKGREHLNYLLYRFDSHNNAGASILHISSPVLRFALFVTILTLGLAVWLYRYDPAPTKRINQPELAGIGGWLFLPALSLLVGPVVVGRHVLHEMPTYSAQQWAWFTDPSSVGFLAGFEGALLFSLAANISQIILAVLLLVLFFQRRSSVPTLYISMMVFTVLLQIVDVANYRQLYPDLAEADPSQVSYRALTGTIISALLWGSYFAVSERVAATFTRRRARGGQHSNTA